MGLSLIPVGDYAYRRLLYYRPYPKQYEFHAAGEKSRERLLLKGNQIGGTYCAANELAMHATGWYPDWWPGRRYDAPVIIWTGQDTSQQSRAITQPALLGTDVLDMKYPEFGTGAIPRETIKKVTRRVAGVPDVCDQILVKHNSGGLSRIVTKTYDQKPSTYTGARVNIFAPDEVCPIEIYTEGMTRTQAAEGGMIMATFTPMKGMTQVVSRFLEPEPGTPFKPVINMTLYDAIGGIWPAKEVLDTPWAGEEWVGHYTAEDVERIISEYAPHERKTRTYGDPMAGHGLVFPVDEDSIKVNPFEIPSHWRRICGIDFGINHPAAAAWLAHDVTTDIIYLYDCYKQSDQLPEFHAATIRLRDPFTPDRPRGWVPVAWPHDGHNRGPASGIELKEEYWKRGVHMLPMSARYDNDRGGKQDPEVVLRWLLERMQTGRFKVFNTCKDFFDEMRFYHRDKHNQLVAERDDVIASVRMATMMIRFAATQPGPRRVVKFHRKRVMSGAT